MRRQPAAKGIHVSNHGPLCMLVYSKDLLKVHIRVSSFEQIVAVLSAMITRILSIFHHEYVRDSFLPRSTTSKLEQVQATLFLILLPLGS